MRFFNALIFSTASLTLLQQVPYVAASSSDDDDDDDDDWSGIEVETDVDEDDLSGLGDATDEGQNDPRIDTSLAEKVDENLSEDAKKLRMTVCLAIARKVYQLNQNELKDTVDSIVASMNVDEAQAVNHLHLSMIQNCYMNMDQEKDLKDLTSGDHETFVQLSERVIAPPQGYESGEKIPGITLEQRMLLHKIVEEEQEKVDKGAEAEEDPYNEFANIGRMELIGSKMNGFQKFLYFVSVFGAVFGGGYLLVKKLIAHELEKNTKRVSKKAAKKDN